VIDFATIQVVSWDVDGTLYELPHMIRRLRWLILQRGVRHPLRVRHEVSRLLALRRAMERVRRAGGDLAGLGLPDRAALLPLEERWYAEAIRRAGLRPGVSAALQAFAARGLRQVVFSDHPSQAKLEALGIREHFEEVYSAEDSGHLKPSPRAFESLLADLGIPASALLHVGDREDTDGAARALGCSVLILPAGPLAVPGLDA
jgi:HAD superfamily hydrolase (TIGR01509 family)